MTIKRLYLIFAIISTYFFAFAKTTNAENFFEIAPVDRQNGGHFEFFSPAKALSVVLTSETSETPTLIKAMTLVEKDAIGRYFAYSDNLTPADDLYLVKWSGFKSDHISLSAEIKVKYSRDDRYKEIYYFDWSGPNFKKVETVRDEPNQTLSFVWPRSKSSLIFGVFDEAEITGEASWYVHPKYRHELMAASRDFKKGSVVKVTNLVNGQEVMVTIKDFGPKKCADWTETENRLMGPCRERILDLSKDAFARIASVYRGLISIKITPITPIL